MKGKGFVTCTFYAEFLLIYFDKFLELVHETGQESHPLLIPKKYTRGKILRRNISTMKLRSLQDSIYLNVDIISTIMPLNEWIMEF